MRRSKFKVVVTEHWLTPEEAEAIFGPPAKTATTAGSSGKLPASGGPSANAERLPGHLAVMDEPPGDAEKFRKRMAVLDEACAKRLPPDLAEMAKRPANVGNAVKPLAEMAETAANRACSRSRQATLSSFTRKERLKEKDIRGYGGAGGSEELRLPPIPDDIPARAIGASPTGSPSGLPLHRCNDCMFGDPPAAPADAMMGWHLCIVGRHSGFGNALRSCSAWMPVTGNTPSAKEATP